MKVLLIGGTGTLSNDTTQLCIDRGFEVYLFNRGHRNSLKADNLQYIFGNINDVPLAKAALKEFRFDVVVDYLTYDVETLKKRIEVFAEKTTQYIFISSATVYPAQEGAITENCEIGNDGWAYAKKKRLCEEYMRSGAFPFEYTIVRPYVTYGIKRIPFPVISKKSCWNLIYRISKDLPILMCGDGKQTLTLTHTRDFAVGIVGLFSNRKAYGEDFNIIGSNVYEWNDVIHIVEKYVGKKAKVVYVPTEVLAKEIDSIKEELLYDKAISHIFDNKKLRDAVPEFATTIDLETGLGETVMNLIYDSSLHVIDESWNAMESILCKRHGSSDIKVNMKQRLMYFNRENIGWVKIKRALKKLMRH